MSDATESPQARRWAALRARFEELADLTPAERERHLDALSLTDPHLARELAQMMSADAEASGVLDRPAVGFAAALMPVEPEEASTSSDGADDGGATDLAGLRLGPWRLIERLGQGGMGEVWLAERADGEFEQQAAIKLIKRGMDSEEVLRRFRRERQILARLDHPRIAHLLDGGLAPDGRPYFVLERVRGATILDWAARGELGVEERIALILQAAEGVEFAHRNLVVHRDLKPSNILVGDDGQVKLLDFGIAKLLEPGEEDDATRTVASLLTPRYAAPEQILGAPATTATDVYALGAVLYELLTGAVPHRRAASRPGELVQAVAQETVPRPSSVSARGSDAKRLSGDLDTILLRALAREPERRYPSVAAFADDLRRHLAGRPVLARGDSRGYRLAKFIRRHRVAVAAASLAVAALLVGLSVALVKERAAREQAVRARAAQEFLASLFLLADPDQAHGAKLTARDVLDRGAARVEAALAGEPELLDEMLTLLGRVYLQLGVPVEAEKLFARSLELERRRLGENDPRLAEGYNRLGVAVHKQAKYAAERPLLERALALYERRGDALGTAQVLNDFSNLERADGHHDIARRLSMRSVAIQSRLGDLDSPGLAKALNNLGIVLWRDRRYRAAAVVFARALEIHRKNVGEVSSLVAGTEDNLAMVLNLAGDREDAQAHIEHVVTIFERLYDRPNPQLAMALNSAGFLADGRGEADRAAGFYQRALTVYSAVGMADHPDVAYPVRNLGAVRAEQGDARGALELYRRALEIRERAFGLEHREVALTLLDVADAQRSLGDLAAAEATLRRALAVFRATVGTQHAKTAEALFDLGEVLRSRGRPEEAAGLLSECLAVRRAILPAGDPGIQQAEEALARAGRVKGAS